MGRLGHSAALRALLPLTESLNSGYAVRLRSPKLPLWTTSHTRKTLCESGKQLYF